MSNETSTFDKPHSVTDIELAFPADVSDLMPAYSEIPDDYKAHSNPWVKWQSKWFFEGLDGFPDPKAGIDLDMAKRHLSAIQRSFQPKHEHKMAAVAYLASLWLEGETP